MWKTETRKQRAELERVWSIRQSTWSRTEEISQQNPDNPFEQTEIRFQGQYYDEETGLHYNRYRYYEPHSARYISKDPIGLDGGLNNLAYVSDPNRWIDPLGLNTKVFTWVDEYGTTQFTDSAQKAYEAQQRSNKVKGADKLSQDYLDKLPNDAKKELERQQKRAKYDAESIERQKREILASNKNCCEVSNNSSSNESLISQTVNWIGSQITNNSGNISIVGEPIKNKIVGSQYGLIDNNAKVSGIMSGGSTQTGTLGAAARGMGTVVGLGTSVLDTGVASGVAQMRFNNELQQCLESGKCSIEDWDDLNQLKNTNLNKAFERLNQLQ